MAETRVGYWYATGPAKKSIALATQPFLCTLLSRTNPNLRIM